MLLMAARLSSGMAASSAEGVCSCALSDRAAAAAAAAEEAVLCCAAAADALRCARPPDKMAAVKGISLFNMVDGSLISH